MCPSGKEKKMCIDCMNRFLGSPLDLDQIVITKELKRAVGAIEELYVVHTTGGLLHIVTDGWNLADGNLEWVRSFNHERPLDEREEECLSALEKLTEKQRAIALGISYGHIHLKQAAPC